MYKEGDLVRLENTNELRVIERVVNIGDKIFYICDNVWYDEELIYPANFKIEVKTALNEELRLSDFGKPTDVINDFVEVMKNDKDKLDKFLELISTSEISFDENPF